MFIRGNFTSDSNAMAVIFFREFAAAEAAVGNSSGAFINEKGQLPHHFVADKPVFQALSGATQTGPNVFWILSCLNYVKHSGNMTWLQA